MSRQFYKNFFWGLTNEPQEMFVEDGMVVFRQEPEPGYIEGAETIDLQGAYVLPAFVDSHCHILPTGLDLAKLHLGACFSHDEVLDAVRERDRELPEGEWLLAVHYDQTRYPEAAHMNGAQIDAAVSARPVVLRHSNGHAGVANAAALRAAGIDASTPDPKGGTFVRDASGQPTGLLLETALEQVMDAAPKPDLDRMAQAIIAAGEKMSELGISCASDMMTGFLDLEAELEAYRIALERGCPIDIRLYLQWTPVLGPRGIDREKLEAFNRNAAPSGTKRGGRIAGVKLFADGAISSATAAIHGTFLSTGESGMLIYSPEKLAERVRLAHEAGYPVAIHSIGDRSTDHVMDAIEGTGEAARHRIEHVMFLNDAQIARLAELGCTVTLQPEFLPRLGHAYRKQLPEEVYRSLERVRSVHEAGIPYALNSDRPVVPGDPWDGILAAARRPDGFDPSESLDRRDAIRAYTEGGSAANGDSRRMGVLEPGSAADFCLYEHDPVTTPRPRIARVVRHGKFEAPATAGIFPGNPLQ